MPQYVLGHCENIEQIESRMSTLPGLELAGNAYHGVGVPNCIQSGEQAAERVLATLGVSSSPALSKEPHATV
jgi:oxygen-dependent protoporphyrinogen oxidase